MQTATRVLCMALPGGVTTMLTLGLENKPDKEARLQQKENGTQDEAFPKWVVWDLRLQKGCGLRSLRNSVVKLNELCSCRTAVNFSYNILLSVRNLQDGERPSTSFQNYLTMEHFHCLSGLVFCRIYCQKYYCNDMTVLKMLGMCQILCQCFKIPSCFILTTF